MNNQLILKLENRFIEHQNPTDAAFMQKYMKGKFEYFGIKSAVRRDIFKTILKEEGTPKKEELFEILKALWERSQREFQYCAVELIEKYNKNPDKDFINIFIYMIRNKSWWDTIDGIAVTLLGNYLKKFPGKIPEVNTQFINSENMWFNRCAILFQLKYKQTTDFELLSSNILKHHTSKEFFIQKAMGWALREYTKTNPQAVISFVQNNQLPSLTKRKALRLIK